MEKKTTKKPASKKKDDVAPKKKTIKKKKIELAEVYFYAPEATPHVETYSTTETKIKASFWSKVKDFLGF
jgi:hypothetical protein